MNRFWRYAAVPAVAAGVYWGTEWLHNRPLENPGGIQAIEMTRPPGPATPTTIPLVDRDYFITEARQMKTGVYLTGAQGQSLFLRSGVVGDPQTLVGQVVHVKGREAFVRGKDRVMITSLMVAGSKP